MPGAVGDRYFSRPGLPPGPTAELPLDRWLAPEPDAASETDSGAESVLATLRVRSGPQAGARLSLCSPAVQLGATPGNDLVLDGRGIVPRHARIWLRGGVWSIGGLDPAGRLLIDGEALQGEHWLAPGSTLQVGEVSLVFDPADRWHDSPTERPIPASAVPTIFPPGDRPFWHTALFVLAAFGIIVVLFFLFRTA